MKYTLEVPPEIEAEIKRRGYDTVTYFNVMFLKPLIDALRKRKQEKILENRAEEIAGAVGQVASQVRFEKEKLQVGGKVEA